MKTLNIKKMALVLVVSLGGLFSMNANAASASVENTVSDFVVAQGQQMMKELNKQLQQTIEQEVKAFSLNFTFDETVQQVDAEKSLKENTEKLLAKTTNTVKKNTSNK
ncbi:hypothetical protein [Litorilituus lipolyticus]|uniref:OmpH family outer membrane protein n=1 Tax=Litorilituus lipolyticus TaxID=2491017 RepID=A0A502KX84_9GAMM|nr:hypothetical protein [Litorilituus lipolyticus]TPH16116.1 hypothetical protein EPA86_07450 [Litorilituus lipolyticus]